MTNDPAEVGRTRTINAASVSAPGGYLGENHGPAEFLLWKSSLLAENHHFFSCCLGPSFPCCRFFRDQPLSCRFLGSRFDQLGRGIVFYEVFPLATRAFHCVAINLADKYLCLLGSSPLHVPPRNHLLGYKVVWPHSDQLGQGSNCYSSPQPVISCYEAIHSATMSLGSVAINSADNYISLLLSSRPATPLSVLSRSSPWPLVRWRFDQLGRRSNHPLYSVASARRFYIMDPSARPRRHSSESPSTGLKKVYLFYCLGLLI